MTTAVPNGAEGPPSSPPRVQAYSSIARSQSTRSRPSTTAAGPPPHRAASTSHHHNSSSNSNRPTSSARPVQDILPHHDYETTDVAQYDKRSSNKDRPPPATRNDSATRPHRRPSQRSTHNPHTPTTAGDMVTAVVNNTHQTAPDVRAEVAARASKSRTTIPTQSGKWILGQTIGAGSMGKVKLAKKEGSKERAACKIIPRISPDDGHHTRAERERADQSKEIRTAREAAIVTLLHHPYICGLKDVVRTNYHWYMLFEYVNGDQMLELVVRCKKLAETEARRFSRQIASALDYCHRNSIVHRDLKIENILVSKKGKEEDIKIIDFGLSNLFAPRDHLRTFCGSLYFAAPELLQAQPYQGPEVDIWSFGVVLYVLVCGRVPFDDQSMPKLHAKIKKGVVDYPKWLSKDCRHLLSRMLVTDPRLRATLQEVMNHPWLTGTGKNYLGPPKNYLPHREPLSLPLDDEVITAMTGFNFGPPEAIKAQLVRTIESEEYQRAVRLLQHEKEISPPPKDVEKKRGFGFDFYKRRNSMNSKETLTAPSSEGLPIGSDPLNAFNPLISIYFLVREKQERDRSHLQAQEPVPLRKEKPLPEIAPPQEAHTNAATYEMPGEKVTGGRTRPRSRTHGEDDAPEKASQLAPGAQPKPEPSVDQPLKKESTAAGIFRRLSRRDKKEPPERLEKDRSHPPVVHVHSPADSPSILRKSFSIRRSRRDRDEPSRLRSGGSQPQHSDLLSPPMSAGANAPGFKKGLGRSASVNSTEFARRKAFGSASRDVKEPPPTSGSDQSTTNEKRATDMGKRGALNSHSVAYRAKSLGHARRESIQARRLRREQEASREVNVPGETDAELGGHSGMSDDGLEDGDLVKPVFLRGWFSVSTTSTRPLPEIRADIKRVLKQLGVEYTEVRGGFSCRHAPSIDLKKVTDQPPHSPGQPAPPQSGHRRRFSFGALRSGASDRDREDYERTPTTPKTPGNGKSGGARGDDSDSRSDISRLSDPTKDVTTGKALPAGETSTHVQNDLGGSMVLDFEIFIVKVPVISLYGIQFKRIEGNTWQYKNMADQILRELRL